MIWNVFQWLCIIFGIFYVRWLYKIIKNPPTKHVCIRYERGRAIKYECWY